jgi:hypothetical protein
MEIIDVKFNNNDCIAIVKNEKGIKFNILFNCLIINGEKVSIDVDKFEKLDNENYKIYLELEKVNETIDYERVQREKVCGDHGDELDDLSEQKEDINGLSKKLNNINLSEEKEITKDDILSKNLSYDKSIEKTANDFVDIFKRGDSNEISNLETIIGSENLFNFAFDNVCYEKGRYLKYKFPSSTTEYIIHVNKDNCECKLTIYNIHRTQVLLKKSGTNMYEMFNDIKENYDVTEKDEIDLKSKVNMFKYLQKTLDKLGFIM